MADVASRQREGGSALEDESPGPPVLAARDLSVARGRRVVASGVSLTVRPGEVIAVVGANGSGKTTLLRVLAGIARPAGGSVQLAGKDLAAYSDRERARTVAYVAQDERTDLPYTAQDVLLLGHTAGRRDWRPYREDDRRAVVELAREWDVEDLLHRRLQEMSGGERRRVLIARAFAQQASLLVLDEPTNHLDLRYQHDLLRRIRNGRATCLMAMHDLDLAARYSTRVFVLDGGTMVANDAPGRALTPALIKKVYGVDAVTVDVDGHARIIVR